MTRAGRMWIRSLLGASLGVLLVGASQVTHAASILPTQDERKALRARAQWVTDADAVDSTPSIDQLDLLPFHERLEADESTPGTAASGVAELQTARTATRIDASGFASGMAEATVETFARGGGDSLYRIEFMVDEPTAYRLRGQLSGTGTDPSVQLGLNGADVIGNSNDLNLYWDLSQSGDLPFDVTGTLFPGVFYFLSGNAFVSSFAGEGGGRSFVEATAAFTMTLIVPEPRVGALALLAGALGWRVRRRI